jgi:hypothetical protein
LRLPKGYVRELTKRGFFVTIGKGDKQRWLNPTEEYRERLRLAAVLHSRALFVPQDVAELGLLSMREVAVILGWSLRYTQVFMQQHPEVQRFRPNSQLSLFSIMTVRELLWKRQGLRMAMQKSPFLVPELIELFQREHAEETELIPTDAEHEADEKIMRKLESIVRRSEADQRAAKGDFARKAELARKIVQILESAKPSAQQ